MQAFNTKLVALACGLVLGTAGSAHAIAISPTSDANTLVGEIVGAGINVVGAASYTGVANQSGTFSGGSTGLSFGSGIVMSTGNVNDIPGTNTTGPETLAGGGTGDDDINTQLFTAGDADLTLLAGTTTHDAAVLEFDFEFGDGSVGGDLYFNFTFASEEYIDFLGSQFNDAFGFYVDGVNIAMVPGTTDPITINTVNPLLNDAYYLNNVENTEGYPVGNYDMRFDGLTTTIQAQALGLGAGTHSMKFAIADAADGRLDAAVFIQGGTFSSLPTETTPTNAVPEPSAALVFGAGLLVLRSATRKRA